MSGAVDFQALLGLLVDVLLEYADQAGWITGIGAGDLDIPGNDRTGANHGSGADVHRQYGGVRANGDPIGNPGTSPGVRIRIGCASAEQVIGKHHAMTNETILADADIFTDKGVGLDPAAFADRDVTLDFHKGSDEGFIIDIAAIQIHRPDDF